MVGYIFHNPENVSVIDLNLEQTVYFLCCFPLSAAHRKASTSFKNAKCAQK